MPARLHHKKGFSLVETVVGVAVFAIIAVGLYRSYYTLTNGVGVARARLVALSVINDELELVRNLDFSNVGIQGGIPAGPLERQVTVARGGLTFVVTRVIRNVDDPFDGTIDGSTIDAAPDDYRIVEVSLECTSCPNFSPIKGTTTVAPRSLELISHEGAIFLQVLDASGNRVPGANVHIINTLVTPNIFIDELANNEGELQLIGVPTSTAGYHISVTKPGYSTAITYPSTPANPNPVTPDVTVQESSIASIALSIDRSSTLNVRTINEACFGLADTNFLAQGAKLIGTSPDVYQYSQATTTNGMGERLLTNILWDDYTFSITDPGYDLVGTIPIMPTSVTPDTAQSMQLIVAAANPKTVLVNVRSAGNNLPLTNARVRIRRSGFTSNKITGEGVWFQTDWSGGGGQNDFIDSDEYHSKDDIDINSPEGEIKLRESGGDYLDDGWLISSAFNSGLATDYQTLSWLPVNQPPETGSNAVRFQIASNNDNATWMYVGPGGTEASYYTTQNADLSLHDGHKYLRYKVYLATNDDDFTPSISDVFISRTSSCMPPGQVYFSGLGDYVYELRVTHPDYQTWNGTVDTTPSGNKTVNITVDPN